MVTCRENTGPTARPGALASYYSTTLQYMTASASVTTVRYARSLECSATATQCAPPHRIAQVEAHYGVGHVVVPELYRPVRRARHEDPGVEKVPPVSRRR